MKKKKNLPQDFLIYKSNDGRFNINVKIEDDTIWLTQAQMAELFEKGRTTITEHIKNVFKEGELDEKSVCRKFRHTADDGKTYKPVYYNLDVIISVGYRVKSQRGTQFRIWANQVLKEYLMKGFVVRPYINIGEQLAKFKDEIIDRIESLEKDNESYNQQFDDFYETLIKLIDEVNKIKPQNEDFQKRKRIGFKLKNEE